MIFSVILHRLYTARRILSYDRSMRPKLIAIFSLACCSLGYADIEVDFPEPKRPEVSPGPMVEGILPEREPPQPVQIDGMLAYYVRTGHGGWQAQSAESFDKLKVGMTLKEIVTLLGPGSQDRLSGIGFICWRCEDGRILKVWPADDLNEKAKYHISLNGSGQRKEDVKRLAKALISKLQVVDQKVSVTLTQDTSVGKGKQTRTYPVGATFQKVEPLPRIDFTIMEIEEGSVHCQYFYQAQPEGVFHYTETGDLILRNREPGAADNPGNTLETKPKGK